MAKIYAISYDLRTPGRNYSGLYDALKSCGNSYQHPLESTWFVATDKSAADVYNLLFEHIDPNDLLSIFEVNKSNYYGWMPKTFWDWYNTYDS